MITKKRIITQIMIIYLFQTLKIDYHIGYNYSYDLKNVTMYIIIVMIIIVIRVK